MDSRHALQHGDVTDKVIGAFLDTYNELAGFPEFVLPSDGYRDSRAGTGGGGGKQLPVWFRGHQIVKFRADLIVQSCVIVEVKARPEIDPLNTAQVLHYLKATDLEVGLLVNASTWYETALGGGDGSGKPGWTGADDDYVTKNHSRIISNLHGSWCLGRRSGFSFRVPSASSEVQNAER
jgi:hypothetical protein